MDLDGMLDERPVIHAAQYVRMSTDNQRFSIRNQADAIAAYASRRGIEIIRTYADAGRSGLTIAGRDSLKQLLDDVQSGAADYSAILVYDISRWGRFQDVDESAHYEFICRQRGIKVHYCAEQFENDGSTTSTILKTLKRAMAGEFSRELSTKVFEGQCRLTTLGYWQGGTAGYGLRRLLLGEDGSPKAYLERGQEKHLTTDRVILVPGPAEEIAVVRRIYHLFVNERWPQRKIAKQLNFEGIAAAHGGPWTGNSIHNLLKAEKYVGHNVYNRTSTRLKQRKVYNPPDSWIRADHVFERIIDRELFDAAQKRFAEQARFLTNDQMLEKLAGLLAARGSLTQAMIRADPRLPSPAAYKDRFGSLERAYSLVGYSGRAYHFLDTRKYTLTLQKDVAAQIRAELERHGAVVTTTRRGAFLTINGKFTLAVKVMRCVVYEIGTIRWRMPFPPDLRPDFKVGVRLEAGNRRVLDFYLFPLAALPSVTHLTLAKDNAAEIDRFRARDLASLYRLLRTRPSILRIRRSRPRHQRTELHREETESAP